MKNENSINNKTPIWQNPSLRAFLGEVKRRHGIVETLALPNMRDIPPIRIEKLFVQPLLSQQKPVTNNKKVDWEAGETLLKVFEEHPRVVLLGDPGSGKTTLINWLAWRLASGLVAPLPEALSDRLPLPCILRDLDASMFARNISVFELAKHLANTLLGNKVTDNLISSLHSLIACGRFVLILDGLDEIAIERRHFVVEWISEAASSGASVVVTGRVVGYDDFPVDREMTKNTKLSWDKEKLLPVISNNELDVKIWADVHYLLPFDDKRIASYIENWYVQRSSSALEATEKAKDLMEALQQSESMQELARTPNLLSLIAIVHRERANLPNGKALLYKEIANAYINTIDQYRRIDLGDKLAKFSWEIKENWIAYVAFQMQLQRTDSTRVTEAGLLASEDEVISWISEAMKISQVNDPISASREFIAWVARRCGLLIPRGERQYAFVHLSFQEYFCARYMAGRVMSRPFIKNSLSEDAPVTKEKLEEWMLKTDWVESFVFLFEIISAENDIEWVSDLAEIIFAKYETDGIPDHDPANLAVRILANNHVYLSDEWRELLAAECADIAFADWVYAPAIADKEIFKEYGQTEFTCLDMRKPVSSLNEIDSEDVAIRRSKVDYNKIFIYLGIGEEVDEIESLNNATRLKYFSLTNTAVESLAALSHCSHLRGVEIVNSPVDSIDALIYSSDMKHLGLQNTKVHEISAVSKLSKLEILDLDGSPVSDLRPISSLTNLRFLSVAKTKVIEISALASAKSIEFLDLHGLSLSSLEPLLELPLLHSLGVNDVKASNIKEIFKIKNLEVLSLKNISLGNVNLAGKCLSLRRLYIGGQEMVDISWASKLKKLTRLDIAEMRNLEIEIFEKFNSLEELILTDVTYVGDHSIFSRMKKLVRLSINGREIFNIKNFK